LEIDIGEEATLNVVTNAPNVGSRTIGKKIIIAKVGAEICGEVVSKRVVGGVISEGMLLDCKSMGWSGGALGNAVLVPDSYAAGSPAPQTRPRADDEASAASVPESSVAANKKDAKEKAKAAAKALREAKKASKAKSASPGEEKAAVEDEAAEEEEVGS
jgi:tRNA-binding EMAP/Myf-like protein